MSIAEMVLKQLYDLPVEKQREVLDFVEFLRSKLPSNPQESSNRTNHVKGALADLGIVISSEEIDAARREMWRDFPRNDL